MGYSADHDVVLISQILMVGNVSSSNVILNHILKFLSSVIFASSHQLVTDGVRERVTLANRYMLDDASRSSKAQRQLAFRSSTSGVRSCLG